MIMKRIAFVCAIILFTTVMLPYISVEDVFADPFSAHSEAAPNSTCEITDALALRMEKMSDDDVISVVIRLRGQVDPIAVNAEAMKRAGITKEQLESYEQAKTAAMNEEEMKKHQAMLQNTYDRIRSERTAIVSEEYQSLISEFLKKEVMEGVVYSSTSKLLPYICGLQLSKEKIYELANSGEVCFIDYFENLEGKDLATVEDTSRIIGGTFGYQNLWNRRIHSSYSFIWFF